MVTAPRLQDVKTAQEFDAIVAGSAAVVVHFWAAWCEPCGQMDRVLEALAANYAPATVHFLRVEAEEVDDLAERYNVVAVPYFVVFKNGEVAATIEGADAPALTAAVTAHVDKAAAAVGQTGIPINGSSADTSSGASTARLQQLVSLSPVMLFMKGSPDAPRCGFSSQVVTALRAAAVQFGHFDILEDPDVRLGLKEFSDWPTYPQLYAGGELVGGADIVLDMARDGELKQALDDATIEAGDSSSHPSSAMASTRTDAPTASAPIAEVPNADALQGGSGGNDALQQRLKDLTTKSRVMLFMKGSRQQPFCRFSKAAIASLNETGAHFGTFDVFKDDEVREGLKEFSDWPTYPQLFVDGELVGGADIIAEMAASKELAEVVCST